VSTIDEKFVQTGLQALSGPAVTLRGP
jgi:hypothetical protein